MSGKFMKVIRRTIPTLTLIVMASQLFGCGAANKDQILQMLKNNQEITIEYAEQIDSTNQNCIQSQWKKLSSYSDNEAFRAELEKLTNNETTENNVKRGTIYYTENPTLQTTLCNTAFINHFDSISKEELFNGLKDIYIDIDENTSIETMRAASINEYFKLFNCKTESEYNGTQKVSRQDFLVALCKATTSPTSSQENIDESEIAELISSNSYIGSNKANNTEEGKITKVEAAYVISNTLFGDELSNVKLDGKQQLANGLKSSGNIAKSNGYDKYSDNCRVATLQKCLTDNKLDDDLYKGLKLLEEKGVIDSEFESNWNRAITKDEAISLIYKALSIKGSSVNNVNNDIIAEELAKAKSEALSKLEELNHVDKEAYKAKIETGLSSIAEIESLISEAEAEEERAAAEAKAAEERAAAQNNKNSNSGSGSSRLLGSTGDSTPTNNNSNDTPSSDTSGSIDLSKFPGFGVGTVTGNPERGDGDISGYGEGGLNLR